MILDITAETGKINLQPKSELEEVIQNVRMILTTMKKTVPMDRDFGMDGEIIDLPIAAAQAKMTAEIVAAVGKYEPRAHVLSVDYEGKEEDGLATTKVKVEINGAEEITWPDICSSRSGRDRLEHCHDR